MALQQESIKWIAGTNFMVDGFRFQNPRCQHYFLTHYHSDHTIGLYKSFKSGTIYCSRVTAALLTKCMGLRSDCIQILPLNEAVMVETVEVTALDANHCPGSVMLLFKVPGQGRRPGQVILHTGDFRYHHSMAEYPSLRNTLIDTIYLDTTYAYPRHTFPSQEEAIATIVRLCKKHLSEEARTLFVFGAYQIGKERAVIGAAKELDLKVHIEPQKRKILSLLELDNMHVFTNSAADAHIHLGFMSEVRPPAMLRRLKEGGGQWAHVVGFRPTGWSFRKDGVHTTKQGLATVYGVPYSEHSSFDDLRACIAALKPRKIIPTVNADTKLKAANLVARFADLMDLSANRYRIDAFFRPRPSKAFGRSNPGVAYAGKPGRATDSRAHGPLDASDSDGSALTALERDALLSTEALGSGFGKSAQERVSGALAEEEQADEAEAEPDSGFGGFETEDMEGLDCEGPEEMAEFDGADNGVSERGEEETFEDDASAGYGARGLSGLDKGFYDAQGDFVDSGAGNVGYADVTMGPLLAGNFTQSEDQSDGVAPEEGNCGRLEGSNTVPATFPGGRKSGVVNAEGTDASVLANCPVFDAMECEREVGLRTGSAGHCQKRDEAEGFCSVGGPDGASPFSDGAAGGSEGHEDGEGSNCYWEEIPVDVLLPAGERPRGGEFMEKESGKTENGPCTWSEKDSSSGSEEVEPEVGASKGVYEQRIGDGESEREGGAGHTGVEAGFKRIREGAREQRIGEGGVEFDPCEGDAGCEVKQRLGEGDSEQCNGGASPAMGTRSDSSPVAFQEWHPSVGRRESSRTFEPTNASRQPTEMTENCSVDIDEIRIDLSTIDSREQAYILRCIEQSRAKASNEQKVKRKATSAKGGQALSKKGSGGNGKKAKLVPADVPVCEALGKDKSEGQTLIRSFFCARKA